MAVSALIDRNAAAWPTWILRSAATRSTTAGTADNPTAWVAMLASGVATSTNAPKIRAAWSPDGGTCDPITPPIRNGAQRDPAAGPSDRMASDFGATTDYAGRRHPYRLIGELQGMGYQVTVDKAAS
jgi:hypothetical protein